MIDGNENGNGNEEYVNGKDMISQFLRSMEDVICSLEGMRFLF